MARHWFDPLSIGFLLILLLIAGYCLEATGWLPELNRVTALILLGGIFGMIFGLSLFSIKASIGMFVILSAEVISWQVIFQMPGNQTWLDKGAIFLGRVILSLRQFLDNQPLQDGILFFIAMSLLFWIFGFGSGFTLARYGNPRVFLFMVSAAIIIIQLFLPDEKRSYFLMAAYCFFLLLLIARLQYLSAHFTWLSVHSTEDQNTFSTILTIVLIVSFFSILIAWNAPHLVRMATPGSKENVDFREKFTDAWQSGSNFFAPLRQTNETADLGMGNSISLTMTRSNRAELVFSVKTEVQGKGKIPNYWKSRSFEYYLDGIWKNTNSSEEIYISSDTVIADNHDPAGVVQFEFFPRLNIYQIYYTDDPVSIDRDVIILRVKGFAKDEVTSIQAVQPLSRGTSYILRSTPPSFSLSDLISATDNYPKDISEIYLQMPAADLSRIRALAFEITKDKRSEFEKVEAITSFLHGHYTYSDSLSGSSIGDKDLIEWFLFDEKRGFCTYFASAEVILLRSIGIPARLAVGYAQGIKKEGGAFYDVRDMDNHAWPEVYFNGIGWVIFEPTPSQPFIDYSAILEKSNEFDQDAGEGSRSYGSFNGGISRPDRREEGADLVIGRDNERVSLKSFGSLLGLVSLAILILSLTLVWAFRQKIFSTKTLPLYIGRLLEKIGVATPKYLLFWDNYIRETRTEKSFLQIHLFIFLLGGVNHQADTARQKVERLIKLAPTCKKNAMRLLDQYEKEKYAGGIADINIVNEAMSGIWMDFLKDRIQKYRCSLKEIFS